MFLHLLQTDEEKEEFIHMAFIVATVNAEDSDEKYEENVEENPVSNDPILSFYFGKRSFSENNNWKMSAAEKAIIDGFLREINSSDDEVNISPNISTTFRYSQFIKSKTRISIDYSRFDKIVDELTPVLSKLTRLSEEERRLEIIERLIEDGIAWDTIEQIEPKSARSMMIELLSVALIDGDYAPLEKVVIESIAKKLSIDADEIEEMEAFVRNMNQVYQSGLEIIIN